MQQFIKWERRFTKWGKLLFLAQEKGISFYQSMLYNNGKTLKQTGGLL